MVTALVPAVQDELDGQWSGYWLDPGRKPAASPPSYRPTGAILRRIGESRVDEFVCLDLVRVEATSGFIWLPLSEAGRYTYAHSLGLLQDEPWRLAVWRGTEVHVYEASYAESLPPEQIAGLYGVDAQRLARPDRPAVQLRLRRVAP